MRTVVPQLEQGADDGHCHEASSRQRPSPLLSALILIVIDSWHRSDRWHAQDVAQVARTANGAVRCFRERSQPYAPTDC